MNIPWIWIPKHSASLLVPQHTVPNHPPPHPPIKKATRVQSQKSSAYQVDVDDKGGERDDEEKEESQQGILDVADPE